MPAGAPSERSGGTSGAVGRELDEALKFHLKEAIYGRGRRRRGGVAMTLEQRCGAVAQMMAGKIVVRRSPWRKKM